jgi:NIMA (never in mitosis gene a)-related kinase
MIIEFRHPNIVAYRESFVDKGLLCIVMDYADGGDLFQKTQKQKGQLFDEDVFLLFILFRCLII